MMTKPTVLITGASAGFGYAMAVKYYRNGHPLVLTARRLDKLETLKERLGGGDDIYIARLDVCDTPAIEQFVKMIPASLRPIGILINNAGLALGLEKFAQANMADAETMIDTNIKGLIHVTKQILPYMVDEGGGHIVNIGSIAGNWPYAGGHVYCATKAFVQQFSRCLRSDVHGLGIRVTNIEPGLAQTEFSLVRFKGDDQRANGVYENKQALTAEDIAEIVYFTTALPAHVNINTLEVMPTAQSWSPLQVAEK